MSKEVCPNCGNPLLSVKCSLCGYSSIPQWMRLRHESGMSMTFHLGATHVNRSLIHKYFRNVCSPTGHPVAAYFPSDDSSLFFVEGSEDGWIIGKDREYRNEIMIDGKKMNSKKCDIEEENTLEIFSEREKTCAAKFVFKFS